MAPGPAAADRIVPVGDERPTSRSTIVILPFTVCLSCPLPGVLAGLQADRGDAVRVHTALGRRLDAGTYASVTGGRATLTQVTGKPSRLDVLELHNREGLLAQAVRAADGSYEIALRQTRSQGGPPAARSVGLPVWGTKIETDPADGTQSVFLAARSIGSVREGSSDSQPGILAIRCMRGRVTVAISWSDFLGLHRGQTIQWRLDATPWVSEFWGISPDGRTLLGPGSAAFLKRLYAARQLAVRATPQGMPAQTLEFRLDGLEEDAAPLRDACHLE